MMLYCSLSNTTYTLSIVILMLSAITILHIRLILLNIVSVEQLAS